VTLWASAATSPPNIQCIGGQLVFNGAWIINGPVSTSSFSIKAGNLTITGQFTMEQGGVLELGSDATLTILGCADLKGDLIISFEDSSQIPPESDFLFFNDSCGGSEFDRVSVVLTDGNTCKSVTPTQVSSAGRLSVLFSTEDNCQDSKTGLPVFAIVLIVFAAVVVVVVAIVVTTVPWVRRKVFPWSWPKRTTLDSD